MVSVDVQPVNAERQVFCLWKHWIVNQNATFFAFQLRTWARIVSAEFVIFNWSISIMMCDICVGEPVMHRQGETVRQYNVIYTEVQSTNVKKVNYDYSTLFNLPYLGSSSFAISSATRSFCKWKREWDESRPNWKVTMPTRDYLL